MALFHFKKGTPKRIPAEILSRYGKWIRPVAGLGMGWSSSKNPDTILEFSKTELYRKIEARLSPGKWLKHLREANGYSQSRLGTLVGGNKPVRAARVSDWESDFRAISKPVAKRLAGLFHVSADRFI
jgi:hypothetical protein